jgi:DNA replication protein DnaC
VRSATSSRDRQGHRNEHGTDRARRCECWRRETTRKLKQKAGIPRRYAKCSFDSFKLYPNENIERAFRRTRNFASTFPAPQQSLLLAGPSGIGKTHLAAAILHQCAEKGISGLYCEASTLLAELRESYDRNAESRDTGILRRLSTTDLLVLDDIGVEQLTHWGQSMLHAVLTRATTRIRPRSARRGWRRTPTKRTRSRKRSADGRSRY